jgi:predicted nucleic acid-binding Zn ribbon protein
MPTYDYLCRTTGRVFEVRHSIHDKLRCWGELCTAVGIAPVTPLLRAVGAYVD